MVFAIHERGFFPPKRTTGRNSYRIKLRDNQGKRRERIRNILCIREIHDQSCQVLFVVNNQFDRIVRAGGLAMSDVLDIYN